MKVRHPIPRSGKPIPNPSAAGARDLLDGLRRLASCEAIADYEPGYINKEFAARQRVVRGLLERNTGWLSSISDSQP